MTQQVNIDSIPHILLFAQLWELLALQIIFSESKFLAFSWFAARYDKSWINYTIDKAVIFFYQFYGHLSEI